MDNQEELLKHPMVKCAVDYLVGITDMVLTDENIAVLTGLTGEKTIEALRPLINQTVNFACHGIEEHFNLTTKTVIREIKEDEIIFDEESKVATVEFISDLYWSQING